MRQLSRRAPALLVVLLLAAAACGGGGGNPSGPSSTGAPAGTATFDGQTIQFTEVRNASSAFRRPSNPAWPRGLLDIRLANCSRPPAVVMALYDGNPAPGRYDVPAFG